MSAPLGTIVIAAHDEEAVIARTLAHLNDVVEQGLVDVVVVCNGCSDRTAEVARTFTHVRVRELDRPSKTAALREGDRLAVPGPRIYLDADIEMTGRAAVETLHALERDVLVGRPPRRYDSTGASWVVHRWYGIRARLPSVAGALWGAGCYALSESARARFDEFPEVIGDDLFIDSLFSGHEVTIIDTDPVVVHTPLRLRGLLLILRRTYRTHGQVCPGVGTGRGARGQQLRDLRLLVHQDPRRAPDVAVYAFVVVLARLRARLGSSTRWERDDSSRAGFDR